MSRTLLRLNEEMSKLPEKVSAIKVKSHSKSNKFVLIGSIRLPSSREARIKLYEEIIGRARAPEPLHRCRPKLPIIGVQSVDPDTKELSTVDVSYLQDYPDRLDALRECIEVMFQSSTEVYKRLDLDGCGTLTFEELEKGLKRLHVPWQQVTGLTRAELFKLLGRDRIDILEFLGKPCLTSRPHWSQLSLRDQWEDYCNKVLDLDLGNTSCSPPLWAGMASKEKRHPSPNASTPLNREDLDYIQSKIVRIERFLSDFAENKRDLIKLKLELSTVTESEDRVAEMKRKRDEEEKEKERIKREAGMALVTTGDGSGKISIFGKRSNISVFNEPSKDALEDAFSGIVPDEERQFRILLSEVGLSLIRGDRIRSAIKAVTNRNSPEVLYRDDFEAIIKYVMKVTPHRVVSDWVSLSQGRLGISLREFLSFCSRPETGICE